MNKSAFPRWLMVALGLAALAPLVGGAWFYHVQERALRREAETNLTAIAQPKVGQIAQWRADQLADAAVLAESPFFAEAVARWLVAPQADDTDQILARFRALQEYYHYYNVLLVDASGQVCLSLSSHAGLLHEETVQALAAALASGQPKLSDLHAGPGNLPPHIDAIAPLSVGTGPVVGPVGAVVLQRDARQFLYPLIQSWPVPSDSAETLLIRPDGEQVLFLNDLRFQPGAALTLRFPLSRTDLPAVMAVLGQEGLVQGVDYRGVKVLAVLNAVPDSPWFMVAKVDAAEVLSAARREATLILALILGLVLAAAVGVTAIWQRSTTNHYRGLYRAEQRHRTILLSVGDGVIVTGTEGQVELLNPVAEALTGWPQAEACGRPLVQVFRIVNEETRQPVEDPVSRVLREGRVVGLANHTLLIARDGIERPIADSGAPIHNEQGAIDGVVLVFRDQTEERAARQALRQSEEKHRALVEQSLQGIVIAQGQPPRLVFANPAMVSILGYTVDELTSLSPQDTEALIHPEDRAAFFQRFADRLTGKSTSPRYEFRAVRKDGTVRCLEISASRIEYEGQPAVQAAFVDITERKQAESALERAAAEWQATFDATADGIYLLDGDQKIVRVNRAWTQMTSIRADEALGKHCWKVMHGTQEPIPDCPLRLAVQSGHRETLEYQAGERWFEFAVDPILDDSGAVTGAVHVMRNITERKRAERELQRSNELLRATIEAAPAAIIGLDLDGNVQTIWNPAAEKMLGWSAQEVMGRPLPSVPAESQEEFRGFRERIRKGLTLDGVDVRRQRRDGSPIDYSIYASPLRDSEGRITGNIAVLVDITERKKAEEALRTSEHLLREIAANYPNSYLSIVERDLTVGFTSGQEFKKQGLDPNSFVGLTLEQIFGEHAPFVREHYLKAFSSMETQFELFINNQHQFYRVVPLLDDSGRVERILAVVENVTERKQAEKALRQRAAQLALLNEIGGQVAALLDVDQVLDRAAHLVQERFGFHHVGLFTWAAGQDRLLMRARAGEFASLYPLGHNLALGEGMVGWVGQHGETLLANDVDAEPRYHNPYPDRLPTRSELSVPIRIGDEIVGVLDVQSPQSNAFGPDDVTALETLAGQLAAAIDNARLYSQAARHNRELTLLNRVIAATATASVQGVEPVLETVCRELAQAFEVPQAAAALFNQEKTEAAVVAEYLTPGRPPSLGERIPVVNNPASQYLLTHKTPLVIDDAQADPCQAPIHDLLRWRGTVSLLLLPLVADGEVVGSLGVDAIEPRAFSDAEVNLAWRVAEQVAGVLARARLEEERRKIEEQFLQAQKMEAVGRLAGGVAHDFNNLLTVIHLSTRLLEKKLRREDPLWSHVQHIQDASRRATDLVRQLLAFSRREIIEPKVLDLNRVVSELDKMLRRLIGEDIEPSTILVGDLWPIKIDPTQIEQVIVNLAVNARDAMPTGGKLTIETANVVLDAAYAATHLEVEPGEYVMLAVSDTGTGMSAEVQARIFEPFFTTKEKGKGTGLGLATVFGVVKQNKGHIRVYSEVGQGTTFKVYLPRASEGARASLDLPTASPAPSARGSETLLLVEDETEVRELVRDILLAQGYRVLAAQDGVAALQVAREHRGPIHLLVTDVVMPRLSGKALADQLRSSRPEMRVLYTSGYTDNAIVHHGVLDEGVHFLSKPFEMDALARKVRGVLDGNV